MNIETHKEIGDPECVNITVKFESDETLDAWIAEDDHQAVINDLDKYRTRKGRWFRTVNGVAPEDINDWNVGE